MRHPLMRQYQALLGVLFLGCALQAQAASEERRVWDALHLGRADSATAQLIARAATSPQRDTAMYFLALAARAVTDPSPRHNEQLRAAFHDALNPQYAIALPPVRPDFPAGFNRERLLTALAGALVDLGDIEFTLDELEARLKFSDHQDAELLWQVVRVVGGDRAKRILTAPFPFRDGEWFPKNLAKERYFPDWADLKRFSGLIPNSQRTLANLEREAIAGCSVKESIAAYYLAYVPTENENDRSRVDNLLLSLAKRAGPDCFWTRMLAARSLALRGNRDSTLWMSLVRFNAEDAYFEAAIARYAFAQHGRDFATQALRWLEQPLNWYVESELASNLGSLMEAEIYRDYWDIWQVRGSGYFGSVFITKAENRVLEPDAVVAWMDQRGSRVNPRLQQRLLATSATRARGATFQKWLQLAAARAEPNGTWWIFQHAAEPAAIPLLRYQAAENKRSDVIERYESSIKFFMGKHYTQCCDATEMCLKKRVIASNAQKIAAQRLDTGKELTGWLSGAPWVAALNPDALSVQMTNAESRIAEIRFAGRPAQQWQHVYGCWIQTPEVTGVY